MSNYKGHLFGGFCAYVGLLLIFFAQHSIPLFTGCEWLLFCLAGSLFPDVDIKSKGQKIFYLLLLLLIGMLWLNGKYTELWIVLILALFPQLVPHRGIFHSTWFVVLVPCAVSAIVCAYMPYASRIIMFDTLFFVTGALSHLLLDFGIRRFI